MVNVHWLSLREETPARGYWDQYLLETLLKDCNEVDSLDGLDSCIVIIPGAYQFALVKEINYELNKVKEVRVILTSDEENNFPLHELEHPNMKLYSTYPHETTADVTWLPIGAPPHIVDSPKDCPQKDIGLFFSGQVNHESRQEMIERLDEVPNSMILKTNGFSQGLKHDRYYELMSKAKVVAAPRGNISPDSFRLYEALENGAVPVAENPDFWYKLFPTYPFPVIEKAEQWRGYVEDAIKQYPVLNNACQAWWLYVKNSFKERLVGQSGDITVVIPVSPIPSDPDTAILHETINSVRYQLPHAKIIITFDGVRKEQEEMREAYNEHIRRVLWEIKDMDNVVPIIFNEHEHQVGMLRKTIHEIKTPMILYVEHDTPLVIDYFIDWNHLIKKIISGESNLIRFHFEAFVPEAHEHLMIGEPEDELLKTVQWSQRPHLASTAFYAKILATCFSKNAKCFIEDVMHGKVMEDFNQYGELGWNQWRIHIYHPEGGNIKRSYNLDGRAGGKKFDNIQKW